MEKIFDSYYHNNTAIYSTMGGVSRSFLTHDETSETGDTYTKQLLCKGGGRRHTEE